MPEKLRLLIELQRLDQTIMALNVTKQKLLVDAAEVKRLADEEKKSLESRSGESQTLRVQAQKIEVGLKAIEEKIAHYEVQLNTVKTNKEYTALQHEINSLKADKSRTEDEVLRMMEQIESEEQELKDLAAQVETAETAAISKGRDIALALSDADARIERITGERAALAEKIPPEFLSKYERLQGKRGGRAMAACRNFVCEGCRMALTANTVNLLMAGNDLIYCHSCGRILYLADDEDVHGGIGAGRT